MRKSLFNALINIEKEILSLEKIKQNKPPNCQNRLAQGKKGRFVKMDSKGARVRFRGWEFFVGDKINLHDFNSSKYSRFDATSNGDMP